MLAAIYKQAIMSAATMILFIAVAPDIFSLFSFVKYMPTYVLTYMYKANSNAIELLFPSIFTIIIATLLTFLASKRTVKIEVAR